MLPVVQSAIPGLRAEDGVEQTEDALNRLSLADCVARVSIRDDRKCRFENRDAINLSRPGQKVYSVSGQAFPVFWSQDRVERVWSKISVDRIYR